MNQRTNRRSCWVQAMLIGLTSIVIALSFYFQCVKGYQPCPLCFMQRVCAVILLVLCSLSSIVKRTSAIRAWLMAQVLFASSGLFFAGRQVWLQSTLSSDTTTCMPGLDMIVRLFPWRDVAHAFLWGSSSCSEAIDVVFGLSMAMWSAGYFMVMLMMSLFLVGQKNHHG